MLCAHDIQQVGMRARKDCHLRAASAALEQKVGTGLVIAINTLADRGHRGPRMGGGGSGWQGGEVVPDSAAHGQGRTGLCKPGLKGQERGAAPYRLNETVDHGRA
ncbi:hypothetical protein D3C85_1095960 [compost metagenome]